tara:strand:- start:1488 stop:2000 length:513 start_codon:yes stop_codon:yes gene_type:complete
MWRMKPTASMACLQVTRGLGEIMPPQALEVSPTEAKPTETKTRSRNRRVKPKAVEESPAVSNSNEGEEPSLPLQSAVGDTDAEGLMGLSADLWTEARVLSHLAAPNNKVLPLRCVHEMHARLKASHKFRCEFTNVHGAPCMVWIADVALLHHYPETYDETKKRFVLAVKR